MMRLDKYLSERLGIPRGESRKLAAKGRVTERRADQKG